MTTKKATTEGGTKGKANDELDAFAHHLAEVLRIARHSELIPASFYNAVGEAWTELQNVVNESTHMYDTEDFIRFNLRRYAEEEGGARR